MRLPDLRDQADEYRAAWATFEALERVAAHRADWANWAAGRGRHTLFMAVLREPEMVAAVHAAQRRLAGIAGLELHERHFLHISIQSCGFDDALALDHTRIAAALRRRAPFEVHLGGVNAFHSAVFLEAHSGGHLLAARRALRAAIGAPIQALDPYPGFLFHLTLGYLSQGADIDAVRAAIRPVRALDVGRVRVERIELVSVPTDQRVAYPELESVSQFALGRP